jgi:16S rRNA (uracil1498-N3)-methyltransferase
MHRFYCPGLLERAPELPEDEAHHAVHVLRLRAGTSIALFDGQGNLATASLEQVDKRKVVLGPLQPSPDPPLPKSGCILAIAPTKNHDRMEWLVEKGTEIGCDAFIPLICHNSERVQLRIDRLQKVAISACKQSRRAWLPEIAPAVSFGQFMATAIKNYPYDVMAIAHCQPGIPALQLQNVTASEATVLGLIGPEGDFSPEEIALAIQHGAKAVHLGAARLRTETAGLAFITAMAIRHWGSR